MNWITIMTKYLPLVMSAVITVERNLTAAGPMKSQVVITMVQQVAEIAGQAIPEAHVQMICKLIDGVVAVMNKVGLFSHGDTAGVPAAPVAKAP